MNQCDLWLGTQMSDVWNVKCCTYELSHVRCLGFQMLGDECKKKCKTKSVFMTQLWNVDVIFLSLISKNLLLNVKLRVVWTGESASTFYCAMNQSLRIHFLMTQIWTSVFCFIFCVACLAYYVDTVLISCQVLTSGYNGTLLPNLTF